MLLWTVQPKKSLKVIEDGFWYKEYTTTNRLKFVDEDYCEEITLPSGREIETMPIYCFASLGGDTVPFFGLHQMFHAFNYFAGYMSFDLPNSVLIELNVPDEKILSAKHHFQSYTERLPGYEDAKKYEKYKYLKLVDTDKIAHDNYVQYVRDNRSQDNIECLIARIEKDDITIIRDFKYLDGATYGTCRMSTVYRNDAALPTFDKTIYVNGDSYPRIPKGSKLVRGDFNTAARLQAEFGMAGVYDYMTVIEAAYCVNEKTLDIIKGRLEEKGITWKSGLNIPMYELFDFGGAQAMSTQALMNNKSNDTLTSAPKVTNIPEDLFALGLDGIDDVPLYLSKTVTPTVIDIMKRLSSVDGSITQEHILLESLESATIEGARTTVENVKLALTKDLCTKSDQMVKNVIAATNWALSNDILSHQGIRHVWELISKDVCENMAQQGDLYRKGMVYIGSNTKTIHTLEKPEFLMRRMDNLFSFCTGYLHPILTGIVAHYYYTYIHPMCDGTGRASRILMQYIWKTTGYEKLISLPLISTLNDNINKYYVKLQEANELIDSGSQLILDCTPFVMHMLEMINLAIDRYEASKYNLTPNESKSNIQDAQ